MKEPVMKTAKGSGVQIRIADWEGDGPPVLCVHGITANCRCWDVVAQSLAPEYRVVAMDLRGRGGSDKPDHGYSLDHHVADIRCILDDLGVDRPAVMGHSLGAFISLAFAAAFPERIDRLVLFDGGGDLSPDQFEAVFEAISPALTRLGHIFPSESVYLEKMKSVPHIHPWSETIENYYRYELEPAKNGVRANINPAHIREESANIRQASCAVFYPKIRCKVLILRATEGLLSHKDLLLPEPVIEDMMRQLPQAQRFDVAATNHYGIVFQPHEGRDETLKEFLQSA